MTKRIPYIKTAVNAHLVKSAVNIPTRKSAWVVFWCNHDYWLQSRETRFHETRYWLACSECGLVE